MRILLLVVITILVSACATRLPETIDYGAMRFSADARERARFADLLADAAAMSADMGVAAGPISEQPDQCTTEDLSRAERTPWVLLANDATSYADWRLNEAALRARLAIARQVESDYLQGRAPDPRYAIDAETWNVTAFARERAASTDPRLQELFARAIRDQVPRIVAFGDGAQPFLEGLSETARQRWPSMQSLALVDCNNTAWIRAQIAEHGWFDLSRYGERADEAAWLMVQHADRTPAFQGEMLPFLEERAATGETSARRVAYLWDRVAVKEGRPQRYGTQMNCENGQATPIGGLDDPEHVEERLAALGMNSFGFYQRMMTQLANCSS